MVFIVYSDDSPTYIDFYVCMKMAGIGELAAGGAVGLAFSLLYNAASALVIESNQFKPRLEQLMVTLNSLIPLIKEIEDGNRELDRPNETVYLQRKLVKGKELIDKLSKVGGWNLFKPYYSRQLVELDSSLNGMLQRLIPVGVRDGQDILIEVRSIKRMMIQNGLHDDQVQNQNPVGDGETRATSPYPPSSPIGLDEPLRELKMKLLHNDQVSMLTVTAPGGSGKTTLVQMFCNDQEVKEKFDNRIFFETVSSKPNLDELETSLEKFRKEVEGNAALLVLDDVWLDSSRTLLEKIHQRSEWSSYKTLVTSREFPKYGSHFPLNPLTDDEAMTLLKESISPENSSGTADELLEQIIKYCKRYPLAITVVGKSLFRESIEMWKEKVIEWSKSSILEDQAILLDRLQPSLDVLGEDGAIIKECFIDLASLPEDGRVSAGVLIDVWAELHSLPENGAIVRLQHLNNRNLAKLVITSKEKEYVDGCYSEYFVTQHDMLRELALHQIRLDPKGESKRLNIDICGDHPPQRWIQNKNKLEETRLLSISTDGEFSSKWDNIHLAKAEVLILNFQTKNYAFPKLNRKMSKGLKVLIVRNNGLSPADMSNLELSSLPNLKRVRLERISISSISLKKKKKLRILEKISLFISSISLKEKKNLRSLEKISMFMCKTGQAFSNSSIRFFEAMPSLVEVNIDYCNDLKVLPADLCGLQRLKKLVITNCHNLSSLPEEIGKLSNLEVLRLRSCTELETLNDSITNLKILNFLDISDCFSIKMLPEDIGQLSKLKTINMRQCKRLQGLPTSIWELENTLKEVICDEETEELWEPFRMIKDLRITVVKEEFNLRWLFGH
ncbi:LOW QUALITY PROTEIN: probable disease resistance protein At5g66900 [Argentina anserina]|uniref:LOW QUALITY PROTEIN: probable disease resistance protein At5g66900 n=1 Tax=Argentina anserina TaxID=57926 RepID=UPI0021768141|nr:LOW QUALITY PROTEIN: probable disease resistance protein At5g66900 [Potentilla anserina]